MKTITKFTLLAILVAIPFIGFAQSKDKKQRIIDANPTSYYPFESVATATEPLVGNLPLELFTWRDTGDNNTPGAPGSDFLEATTTPYPEKGAVLVPKALHVKVPNPVLAEGDERLRTYTLLYDFNYPPMEGSTGFLGIFQGSENNSDDEDICIKKSDNTIGIGSPGYAVNHPLSPNTWYRFVVTFAFDEAGEGIETLYIDGEEILTVSTNST